MTNWVYTDVERETLLQLQIDAYVDAEREQAADNFEWVL